MSKFIKKQVEVEAITFDELVAYGIENGGNTVEGMPWSFDYNGGRVTHENDECYIINTLEGDMRMTPDDMLITGVNGEIYPCKIEIFNKTYRPSKQQFTVGEWIIATRPLMVESFGGYGLMGTSMKPDRGYMHKPIQISAITEHHLIYETKSFIGEKTHKHILPMDEVRERGFVVADAVLVEAATRD